MRFFCTLFDSSFLSRGLVMINSLIETHDELKIVVFAFDELTAVALERINIDQVIVVRLEEFETPELLSVKESRTKGEYCWTSTPMTILYCLEKFGFDHCTYLDADLYFLNNTKSVLDEMIDHDQHVFITPHFYTSKYDQTETSGTFCVQYMLFRSTPDGLEVLRQWKNDCLEWCYARFEDGKFGDQLYLDRWPLAYGRRIKISSDRGLGVAPWNVQQYGLLDRNSWLLDKADKESFVLKFYHFHALRFTIGRYFSYGWYPLPRWARGKLYPEYITKLNDAARSLQLLGFNFNPHSNSDRDLSNLKPLSFMKRSLLQLCLRG